MFNRVRYFSARSITCSAYRFAIRTDYISLLM
nr:MAG TPA: hypothetical protein [Bacteriophage sp.]